MNTKLRHRAHMITEFVRGMDGFRYITCAFFFIFAALLIFNSSNLLAQDPYEGTGNNTRATATAFTFTGDTALFAGAEILGVEDLDWYSFTGSANDSIVITLVVKTQVFDGKIVVYDDNDVKLAEENSNLGGTDETLTSLVLESAGKYYIGIGIASKLNKAAGFELGVYDMMVSRTADAAVDPNEPNNTNATATGLLFTNNQVKVSGIIGTISDKDIYTFISPYLADLRDSIDVTLAITSGLLGKVSILDSAGNTLSEKVGAMAGSDVSISDSDIKRNYTGIFYIVVEGSSNKIGSYSLTVNRTVVAFVNNPPIAAFTLSVDTVGVDANFTVDASGVSDPEDAASALEVRWQWETDGAWTSYTTDKTATHSYDTVGTYTITLEVKDTGDLTATTTKTIVVAIVTDVEEENAADIPTTFELSQNYPNPFNPNTKIDFNLSKAGQVQINVYNILGQKVRMLINEVKAAGHYSVVWDGMSDNGVKMSSGIYIYRMEAANFMSTKKMLMLK